MKKRRRVNSITPIVDSIIDAIESRLDGEAKYVIKTETIKSMVKSVVPIKHKNPIYEQLLETGLTQSVEQRLYVRGYRSIRQGLFINFDKCNDPYEIFEMLKLEKERTKRFDGKYEEMLKAARKKCTGESYMVFDDQKEFAKIYFIPTEEEFMAKLEAGAI